MWQTGGATKLATHSAWRGTELLRRDAEESRPKKGAWGSAKHEEEDMVLIELSSGRGIPLMQGVDAELRNVLTEALLIKGGVDK